MARERHRQGELEQRVHRPFALYTVIQCWMRGLDGVIFKREHLLRILDLNRAIKTERLKWLKADLGEYFAHLKPVMRYGKTNEKGELNSLHSLWVSRHPFPQGFWAENLDDEPRLAKLSKEGPRIAIFKMWPDASSPDIPRTTPDARIFLGAEGNYDERLLASYLSLLCRGLISPQSVPSLQPDDDDDELLKYASTPVKSRKKAEPPEAVKELPVFDDEEFMNYGSG